MIPVGRGPNNDPHVRISKLVDRVWALEKKVLELVGRVELLEEKED